MAGRVISFLEAIREAIDQEMSRDESIVILGEDVGVFGGMFGTLSGLIEKYGEKRIIDTPISESGFIGACVGAAATGLRPIAELRFIDFFGVCWDQIYNQAAKLRYMTGGQIRIPMVIRASIGGGKSASVHHSQCLYAIFAHVPGLEVVIPSSPYDAKGLLISAIRSNNPTIFLEHKSLYGKTGEVPEEPYTIPFGEADIKREGDDVTIVALGWMVYKSFEAAEILEKRGISVEIIDPRTIAPLDEETILKSLEKTGRLIIVDEDYERCSIASEIAAIACDKGFDYLDAPIKRVCNPGAPPPYSPPLENAVIPSAERIVDAVLQMY